MMFLDCPGCLDQEGAVKCGLPAEVKCRFTMCSTSGPLDSVIIRCPVGHHFSGPIEFLTPDGTGNHDPGTAIGSSLAVHHSSQCSHDGRDDGSAHRNFPAAAEREARRPNIAPAYYLGRPAAVWITGMRPRSRRIATGHLIETAGSDGNPARDSGVLRHE